MTGLAYRRSIAICLRRDPTESRRIFLVVPALTMILCACSSPAEKSEDGEPSHDRTDPEMMEQHREMLREKQLEKVEKPMEPITGEVPDEVMETIVLALEKLTGADRSTFELVTAEERIWPDGALGCPQPGMNYTQALVPGYQVILKHNGREYDYRTGGNRYLMLCLQTATSVPSPEPAPRI